MLFLLTNLDFQKKKTFFLQDQIQTFFSRTCLIRFTVRSERFLAV